MSSEVKISLKEVLLIGNLSLPQDPLGIVLFAHGSGSSRFSPRNQFVSNLLNKNQIATLLIDLLTEEEEKIDEKTAELRFNLPLLSERLTQVTDWLSQEKQTSLLQVAYFGASTGAAASLIAAAKKGKIISSVVSRGGRPDLAEPYLSQVHSPTLLIVGESDKVVIELNRNAYALLSCPKKLEIVPGATHLFEEPGCLEKAAQLACKWFIQHFNTNELL